MVCVETTTIKKATGTQYVTCAGSSLRPASSANGGMVCVSVRMTGSRVTHKIHLEVGQINRMFLGLVQNQRMKRLLMELGYDIIEH
jgi:hypothetical protein